MTDSTIADRLRDQAEKFAKTVDADLVNLPGYDDIHEFGFELIGLSREAADYIDQLRKERDEALALVERVKLEAQIHAQEARTANGTIYEIYQVLSGGKGEPGNWHGAEPARQFVASAEAALAAERELAKHRTPSGDSVWLVLEIDPADHSERPAIFSSDQAASEWCDREEAKDCAHVVSQFVVDVPEFGNEAQEMQQ